MANISAPFGFQPVGSLGGASPSFRHSQRKIASTNGTAIYVGDAVVPVTSTATGYITQATAGSVAMAGIFVGCQYLSISSGRWINGRYWPGSDASGDVIAYVIDNPDALFNVQSDSTGLPFAKVGQNLQLNVGAGGNTATGFSGMYVSGSPGTTSTYPFIYVAPVAWAPGVNGGDSTTAYNVVTVGFNNEIFKTGITGIS
jgi:hypothetical protein